MIAYAPLEFTSRVLRQAFLRGRRVISLTLVLVLLATLMYFAIGSYVALQLTQPPRKAQLETPAAYGLPYEEVTFPARDGVEIAAWFIPAPESDRVILLLHGRERCRSCEFDGRFVEFASRLQANGFNVLMIDHRAHGQSGGEHFTLGLHERWDVLAAVDWLHERGLTKIGVLGTSMGTGGAVAAAADPEGGTAIRALVLDSGVSHIRGVLDQEFTEASGLPHAFLPGSLFMGRLLLDVDLNAFRPVDDLAQLDVPLMLIFSEQDDVIPLAQFYEMAAARPDAETWLVPDGSHTEIYPAHPEEYVARVTRFFDNALK